MPRELVATEPRKPVLVEYEEPPLKPNQVRIKSTFSAEKHGTTLLIYRGLSPFSEKAFDPSTGLFMPRCEGRGWSISFPIKLGNMTVGIVTEVGSQVKRFRIGDRVYGYLPIRETHTVNEENVNPAPPELSDEEIVCIDPAVVALMAVREGHVRIGDTVAVFGLGAIGLMTVQMAKLSGALLIIGVEPVERRRKLAEQYGADITLNPNECDAGLEIKKVTGWKGVDVSIETSGSYSALHHSIRGTGYGGTIVPVSWYHGEARGLNLGEEWHFNRQIMVSGARVESEPYRDYPLWDRKRIYEAVINLFKRKLLRVDGILSPIVRFEDVAEAYRLIDERPEETIKLGVKYS
ncbi:MAG: zinc-binding alcohol dehydrogenase [Candidatus Bathyarchaeota archaeon]|nr:zinc-binding alcohol dehydrogenase [Candidatus Bathyarchaeota archaeon]